MAETQDSGESADDADGIIKMEDGRVVQDIKPAERSFNVPDWRAVCLISEPCA